MRQLSSPSEHDDTRAGAPGTRRTWLKAPTAAGLLHAAAGLLPIGAATILLLIPAVFFLVPLAPEVDAMTLCLPGVGPVHRFREDLQEDEEEVVFLHERVHADQCRRLGATGYARKAATPQGRLRLEAEALCAEVTVRAARGDDRQWLVEWTVEALQNEYFPGGEVTHEEITAAVGSACGEPPGVPSEPPHRLEVGRGPPTAKG